MPRDALKFRGWPCNSIPRRSLSRDEIIASTEPGGSNNRFSLSFPAWTSRFVRSHGQVGNSANHTHTLQAKMDSLEMSFNPVERRRDRQPGDHHRCSTISELAIKREKKERRTIGEYLVSLDALARDALLYPFFPLFCSSASLFSVSLALPSSLLR